MSQITSSLEERLIGEEKDFFVPGKLLNITFWDSNRLVLTVYYGEPKHEPFLAVNPTVLNFHRNHGGHGLPSYLENPYLYSFVGRWYSKKFKTLTYDEYEELMGDIYFLIKRVPFIEGSVSINDIANLDRTHSKL